MKQDIATAPEKSTELFETPLNEFHRAMGARMVPFAGYSMPVHYSLGVLKEHLHTRSAAGLFDVSHMGQADLVGPNVAQLLETLVPADLQSLKPGRICYTQLLNDTGGIVDDLMLARPIDGDPNRLHLVVNAGCKKKDYALIASTFADLLTLERKDQHALLALQGPKAFQVLARFDPDCAGMPFMSYRPAFLEGMECFVSRCGYTGEDGFEISVPAQGALNLARRLAQEQEVEPIGLGARDSLRLEAGLCLYGHELDEDTSPIAADLGWSIGKRRRAEGGFAGDERILSELNSGSATLRIGLKLIGPAPARQGAIIETPSGKAVGKVTSGGFSPSLSGAIAMGYVNAGHAVIGSRLHLIVRGKALPAEVVPMPFISQRYFRGF